MASLPNLISISHSRELNLPPKLELPAKNESKSTSLKILPDTPDIQTIISKGIPHFTSDKLDDILNILKESSIHSAFVSKGISDQGRIKRCITDIQEALQVRKLDFEFYLERLSMPASSTTAVFSPTTPDSSPNSLSHCLFEFQRAAGVLNEKLKAYKIKPTNFINAMHRKNRLLELVAILQESWMHLMIQLSLSISRASSEAASTVTGKINQIAVATGAEDYSELSMQDAKSFYMQGEKYFLGYGTQKSLDLAYKRYHSAAKLGLPEAATMLGFMHENGLGTPKDIASAITWYKNAAQLNHADAFNHLGRLYELGKGCKQEYERAVKYYRKAADLGHLDGMTNFGLLQQEGLGCKKDLKGAFESFQVAADQGYARAQNALGNCFYQGRGTLMNYELAVQWFKKASDQGNACAHNHLGICFEEGKGVVQDLLQAKLYYKMAADLNHANGMNNLAYIHLLQEDYMEAIQLFHIALALGSRDAAYNLGMLYESGCSDHQGSVLMQDLDSAIRYYTIGAEKKCPKSQWRVSRLLLFNPQSREQIQKAIAYLTNIATPTASNASNDSSKSSLDLNLGDIQDKGHADAQNLLGELYELGTMDMEQEQPNYEQALHWYRLAYKQGHARAAFNLAAMYEQGRGVDKDFDKAAQFYLEANKRGSMEATEKLKELERLEMLPL